VRGKNECLDEKNILKFDYIQVITSSVLFTEGPVWLNLRFFFFLLFTGLFLEKKEISAVNKHVENILPL
jgi:hypothetical protein